MKQKVVEDWKRLVYGEVYVPYRIDTDMEFATPEEIEKAAYYFMEQSKTHNVDEEHDFKSSDNIVVQSYIAKENDPDGFVPGSWIAVGQIKDDAQWELVKQGKLNGWSMAGVSDKVPRRVKVTALKEARLQTEESTVDNMEPHSHEMVLRFENGRVLPTTTFPAAGHNHQVVATTATEEALGHSHRFNLDWSTEGPGLKKEEKEIEAVELVNIQPQWLSLVEHAATRRAFKMIKTNQDDNNKKTEWTTAYINSLPNSSFAVIENGYKEGESPKTARHLPYKDASGNVDLPHLRNALARMNQIKSVLGTETDMEIRARAEKVLRGVANEYLKEEVQPLDRVVHAIVSDLEFDDVLKLEELGWIVPSDVRFEERIRIGKENKYVLIPTQSFVKGSLETRETAKDNVKMIVGILKEETAKNAIEVEEVNKAMDEKQIISMVEDLLANKLTEVIKGEISEWLAEWKEDFGKTLGELKSSLKSEVETSAESVKKSYEEEIEKLRGVIEILEKSNSEVTAKTEELKTQTEELVSKTEELSQKATSISGATSTDDETEMKKSETDYVDWFMNNKNPLIQKILAG